METELLGAGPLSLLTGPGDFYDRSRLVCRMGRTLYLGGYHHMVGTLLGHPPAFGSKSAMTVDDWARTGPRVL
ncbi:hypothetical protein [Arthrobacter sp. SDTb3-6]|uniref:hypothetical protein n=1 Tax=Arthrobacter sp. SDTb3-6 TaxID=2713571 RepID=UPI00210A9BCB|nr:hypothetical protein [Arthrobacter sp. SDTb3-6]